VSRRSPRARARPRTSSPASSRRRQLSTSEDQVLLAPLTAEEWPAAALIYKAGIEGANATFESGAPAWEDWPPAQAGTPAIVARGQTGEVLGWAALSPVSARACYSGVGSVSIYVAPAHAGRGVGGTLLQGLIEASERVGMWTLEAGIFPENQASVALHESCGFRLVGRRERVGRMPSGRWRDVLLFERRSKVVGDS
jgi:L-amino acid N-acyltransferase YncA